VVQGESPEYCKEMYADAFQDNPEDNIQWAELHLKVLENDCPAFAANGLLRPNFHRPKPKKISATVTSESLARSRQSKGARRHTLKKLRTKKSSATSIGPRRRPQNLADETWLQARGWTMDDEGLWSNADPLFRCRVCEPAGRPCRYNGAGFVALKEATGGGLYLTGCTWYSRLHVGCSVASRHLAKRYYWVQADHGGPFQWESAGRDDPRRRADTYIPRRNVSRKVRDDSTTSTSDSSCNHAQRAGPSRQAQGQEYDVYGTDTITQDNDLDTLILVDADDQHLTPTSVNADLPPTYGQEVMNEEQASDSEEEMTYVGWEKVRSGHTAALEVELGPLGPGIGSLDQDMYDDYDEHMPSLGEQVDEESNKAETSMAAAEQTQCKSVSQLLSTWSSLIDPGIWISGTVSSSRSRV
jgi:hypothetical protein